MAFTGIIFGFGSAVVRDMLPDLGKGMELFTWPLLNRTVGPGIVD